jgi:hypothetical protein
MNETGGPVETAAWRDRRALLKQLYAGRYDAETLPMRQGRLE